MTAFSGAVELGLPAFAVRWGTRKDIYGTGSVDMQPVAPSAAEESGGIEDTNTGPPRTPALGTLYGAVAEELTGPSEDFFERMHVIPRSFLLGNVLATQTVATEIFNGYRRAPRTWTAFTNNGGEGISLLGSPSLPEVIANLGSVTGLSIEVTTVGPPTVSSTLDFTFDSGVVSPAIVFQRVVLFAVAPPERPFTERLSFLTGIIRAKGGKEQRIRHRRHARQIFPYSFFINEGEDRSLTDHFMFGQLGQSFGVPVWQEMTFLTAAASTGETTINVENTTYADFRVGGFVVVYTDGDVNDVLEIESTTATSITVTNALVNDYGVRTRVMPLRICASPGEIQVTRYIRNLNKYSMSFRVVDNATEIEASPSWVSEYNSKIFVNGYNWTRGPASETLRRELVVLDSKSGAVFQGRINNAGDHVTTLTFLAVGRQQIWEMRQLLHKLRGRQTSFYLPTNQDDLTIVNDLVMGASTMDITNVGYTQFVNAAAPRDLIRITFNDGSPALMRGIASTEEQSSTVETLTMDGSWAGNILASTVQRIEFVELVRLDTDDVDIVWDEGERVARCTVPVKAVLQ